MRILEPITDLAASTRQAGADLAKKAGETYGQIVDGAGAAARAIFGSEVEALGFDEVLDGEMQRIDDLRVRRRVRAEKPEEPADRPPMARAHWRRLVGLSFSGGGIRSATFNLGILQALAQLRLLRHFDYLSTVSGGGYIGSWLTAWIKRRGLDAVCAGLVAEHPENPSRLAPGDEEPKRRDAAGDAAAERPEHPPGRSAGAPITFLRAYSNYLTPRKGPLSLDTWMAAISYLRNLVLNLNVLVFALVLVLLLPRLLVALILFVEQLEPARWRGPWALPAAAALLAVVSAYALSVRLRGGAAALEGRLAGPAGVRWTVVAPVCGVALLFVLWLYGAPRAAGHWPWILAGGGLNLGFWLVVSLFWFGAWLRSGLRQAREFRNKPKSKFRGWFWRDRGMPRPRMWLGIWFAALVAGGISGWLSWLVLPERPSEFGPPEWLRVLVWAPPGVLLVFILGGIYFVGLLGRGMDEKERQWWSRSGGAVGLHAVGWLGLFLAAFYAPPLLRWLAGEAPRLSGSVGLGWVLSTVSGVIAGRSPATSRSGSRRGLELVARTAPYVFILGIVGLLSLGLDAALPRLPDPWGPPADSAGVSASSGVCQAAETELASPPRGFTDKRNADLDRAACWLAPRWWPMLGLFGVLALATAYLSWRVDINEFSMHNFYRDRLTRPYLGASRRRREDRFTGFDPEDDILLHRLWARETQEEKAEREELEREERQSGAAPAAGGRPWDGGFDGPFPILNATLNLSSSQDPTLQERQASSFVFTPQVHGFEPTPAEKRQGTTRAYRPIRESGKRRRHRPGDPSGISLGTAMTVSGAAVNPNMGYHSAPALAFLMTVFNARLGRWMGNSAHQKTWDRKAPTFGLAAQLRELLGMTAADTKWINLADGGFFDNLGIYELVRRRCRFILACDAEADPDLEFNALGNAIRRCRADFGIDIRFENLEPLKRRGDDPFSRWHCAVGTIHYDRVDRGAPKGILVYVKASLTGDEPADLLNYHRRHPDFPHESTGDQWFGESQFESYRRLGQHVGLRIFRAIGLEP